MAGFCCYGATGVLTINSVPLNTPAWDVPDLVPLWVERTMRGENKVLPNAAFVGQRGNPRRLDPHEIDLAFVIVGSSTTAGVAISDPWQGLQSHLDALWTAVFAPVTTGRGTHPATLTMPSGAVLTADVQVDPLTFPNDIDDPEFVLAVIHLTVISGAFA